MLSLNNCIHKNGTPQDYENLQKPSRGYTKHFPIPKHYSLIEKLHLQRIFCVVTTLIVHPRVMKIHKNLPGDTPNNFPHQNIILSLRNWIHK